MFRLRLLGGACIERSDGAAVVGRVAQRHRLALLALLACTPGRGLSRDKLIGLLWPESDTERARNLLNVSVYELRKALGDDALLSGSDELRLNPEVVGSDVAEFEEAIVRGDHEAAVSLYQGPLLDGFFVDDAPDFERWADGDRARLASAYGGALEALAEAAERQGDFRGGAVWWGRRAAHDPYDSRVTLSLMRALTASGNVAGALQHASIHERLLQQELGLKVPSQVAALAEQMRREPARGVVVAEVAELPRNEAAGAAIADPIPSPPSTPTDQLSDSSGGARGRRMRAVSVALVAIATLALAWVLWPTAPKPERSVAVLPFVNMSPDGDNEYLSDGLTEEITSHLSAIKALKVISRTSAMHYKGTTKALKQIAAELGVAHVLEGSVRRQGDTIRITAQLIDAGADHHLWARSYNRTLVNVLGVQDEIAREVGRALEVELSGATEALGPRGTRDPEAYAFYRRGRFLWAKRTSEGHELAMQYYQRAIERDSSYADPYSGIADAYLTAYQFNLSSLPEAEVYSRMKGAAERALALDDRSADAHSSIANALWWQRDWLGAEREFRRAIELNPGHPSRNWYALLLSGMGRVQEAVQQTRRAAELDPLAHLAIVNEAWLSYVARDYDFAIKRSLSALEINNAFAPTHATLGLAYSQKGMHDAAIRAASKAVELGGPQISSFLAGLAYVHARAGRRAEAEQFLRRAKVKPWEGFSIARAHIALNEPDSAFAWFARSSWQWPHRALRADPALDPVRSDPRFAQLSARVEREMGMR